MCCRFTRIVMLLAVLAVLLRALVPVGYMPETGKVFHITICSMEGAKTIAVDENNAPVKSSEKPGHEAKETCPFSIVAHTPFVAEVMVSFAQILHVDTIFADGLIADQVTAQIFVPAQSQPRAPPSFV